MLACMGVCISVSVCPCVFVRECACACVSGCVCACVCECACAHVCICMYMCLGRQGKRLSKRETLLKAFIQNAVL